MHEWIVTKEDTGLSLVAYIRKQLQSENLSSRQIKRAIESNACSINQCCERFASRKVQSGDSIQFKFQTHTQKQSKNTPTYDAKRIIFHDTSILVYNKPAKIDVYSLESSIQTHHPSCRLVHRLDKDTSGVLLLAKDEKTLKQLTQQFAQRKAKKEYLAVVDGIVKKQKGKVMNKLGKRGSYQGQTLWGEDKNGKEAITYWEKVKEGSDWTLLRCYPQTGRTHQIRVHLSQLAYPILGDMQYGRQQALRGLERHLLHAASLEINGMRFEAPSDWEDFHHKGLS
ncbi:Pseudouridine synthase [Chlamydiales bacterium SCGC AG-110-M15]|nr:Pseudouridine synthase [Chlamydiales bacterium SCGC AG-110-M15]